ncbi:unnamed protein product, partial [Sphacelaria rigidula]
FSAIAKARSATSDPHFICSIIPLPKALSLAGLLTLDETEEVLRATAGGEAMGLDGLSAELKLELGREPPEMLFHLHSIIVVIWASDEVSRELKNATVSVP